MRSSTGDGVKAVVEPDVAVSGGNSVAPRAHAATISAAIALVKELNGPAFAIK